MGPYDSRDLREYGIERYGELPGEGLYLVSWALDNYRRESQWVEILWMSGKPVAFFEPAALTPVRTSITGPVATVAASEAGS